MANWSVSPHCSIDNFLVGCHVWWCDTVAAYLLHEGGFKYTNPNNYVCDTVVVVWCMYIQMHSYFVTCVNL
jgi:hypothetical protein